MSAILKVRIELELFLDFFATFVAVMFPLFSEKHFHILLRWLIFFSISVNAVWADVGCLKIKIFFELRTLLLLLKVNFMVLFAVFDIYRPDRAGGGGDTDSINLGCCIRVS